MSPYGQGAWAEKLPGDLSTHLEIAVPYLAETAVTYYNRLNGKKRQERRRKNAWHDSNLDLY